LVGHASGLSGVPGFDAFVGVTLHLLAGLLACLEPLVSILERLLAALLAGCSLPLSGLLLRRCRESDRASGNNHDREN
jgi:hypothetical protein